MKKLFANKKIALSVLAIILGVGLLLTGLSGAWWYITPDEDDMEDANGFNMGELKVAVALVAPGGGAVYEPGKSIFNCGLTIENEGSIDAFIKLDFDGAVIIDDFDIIDGNAEDYVRAYIDLEAIEDAIDDDEVGDILTVTGNYMLFKDNNDVFYLFLEAGKKFELIDCVTVEFLGGDDTAPYADLDGSGPNSDGDQGMNNAFMLDTIYISLNWEATQNIPKAILSKLEVTLSDLTLILPVD